MIKIRYYKQHVSQHRSQVCNFKLDSFQSYWHQSFQVTVEQIAISYFWTELLKIEKYNLMTDHK